jgi:hypothetical protein
MPTSPRHLLGASVLAGPLAVPAASALAQRAPGPLPGLPPAGTPVFGGAPEIDPGTLRGGLALLAGGILILTHRRFRRSRQPPPSAAALRRLTRRAGG